MYGGDNVVVVVYGGDNVVVGGGGGGVYGGDNVVVVVYGGDNVVVVVRVARSSKSPSSRRCVYSCSMTSTSLCLRTSRVLLR